MNTFLKWVIRIAVILAIAVPIILAVTALGSKFGWWHWRLGLGTAFNWVPNYIAPLALNGGVAALIAALVLRSPRGVVAAALAIIIPVAVLYQGAQVRKFAGSIPSIHDITTDTQNPPMFTDAIMTLRGDKSNPVNYVGKTHRSGQLVSEMQLAAYPDVKSLTVGISKDAAFDTALAAAKAMGWEIVTEDVSAGLIEATETTFWYGFKDDVIIRLSADGADSTIIDVRSVSRVGGSDLGANAARIKKYMGKLD